VTKLVIQIPCYNEEDTLPRVLEDLPESIEGVDCIETLVINDGSTDRTLVVAREHGVDYAVQLPWNRGLAYAWGAGIAASLQVGADIIVNTDGDNQYDCQDIEKLVQPILENRADIVIGARPIDSIGHFSWLKKRLQWIGSHAVSRLAGVRVDDAVSGFRAYSAEAARELNLLSDYTHCIETLIRAARRGLRVEDVPIHVNEKLRDSRLMTSVPHYLMSQARDVFRVSLMLHPLKILGLPAALFFLVGLAGSVRFLVYYFSGQGSGHIQSVVFSVTCIMLAVGLSMVALLADMIATNHLLLENALVPIKKLGEEVGTNSPIDLRETAPAHDGQEHQGG
jgi:glycosyltransferase involved in cell wall biosynthesis